MLCTLDSIFNGFFDTVNISSYIIKSLTHWSINLLNMIKGSIPYKLFKSGSCAHLQSSSSFV